jgi:uridine phosphorylase
MIAYVENAASAGQWAIICMHGVGGEHIAIATEALAELCSHLEMHRDRIRTDTVIAVADSIVERRKELNIIAP